MKAKQARACIYPKDVQSILGKSYRQGRLYLNKIKKELNKEPHQFVSIDEFCTYSGLQKDHILDFIVG